MLDKRLVSLRRQATVLATLSDLSPPQLLGAQLAILTSADDGGSNDADDGDADDAADAPLYSVAYDALRTDQVPGRPRMSSLDDEPWTFSLFFWGGVGFRV